MGLFNKLFGNKENVKPVIQQDEHAVIIYFNYGLDGMEKLYELSDKLENIIKENKLGEFDGHEIAVDLSDGTLYMYGPNAELLFKGIKPTLESTDFLNNSKAKLRFGNAGTGAKEIIIEINNK